MKRKAITWELSADLAFQVCKVAKAYGISTASAADRLLLEGLEAFSRGEIDFDGYLVPNDRGRYRWSVEVNPNGLGEAVAEQLSSLP